jgi:hypothetical protein
MKTIRESQLTRAWSRRSRVGDIVTTEAAAWEDVRRAAENLKAPYEDFNGEAFLIVPGRCEEKESMSDDDEINDPAIRDY